MQKSVFDMMMKDLFAIFVDMALCMRWCKILFGLTERINEVRDEIFFCGFFFDSFFFVFDDDFVISDFDDFSS